MSENDFDIFVIGAGSGGVRAARLAASLGAKVAIAEEYRYGGTCVIRGCVPKKLMVNAADFNDHFLDSAGFGWSYDNSKFSWKKFRIAKDREIDRLEEIYQNNLKNSGVTLFNLRAKLNGENSVKLDDSRIYTAKTILLAMGGHPFIPDFTGRELVITSDEIFNLSTLPTRILIVGGGYIASEFAGIFNGLRSNVIQVYRGKKILRGFDEELRDHLTESMIFRGIDLRCNLDVVKCEKKLGKILVTLSDGTNTNVDTVLYATGRQPNTNNMDLEQVGVKVDKAGAVIINEFQKSTISSIYAVGDVTNRLNLTPVAIRDAIAFVETVVKNNLMSPDHQLVATAVFTRPEIGTIGQTEEQASKLHDVEIYRTKFRPMANTISGREEKSIMKLIVEKGTRKILGCHLVGPGSAEMIQLAAVAIKMGATKEDFDRTCAVHPTAAEELVTLS